MWLWRPVMEGLLTASEVATVVSIDGIADAHDILDAKLEAMAPKT